MAGTAHGFKSRLYIPKTPHQIRKDDIVKGFCKPEFLHIPFQKLQGGMTLPGQLQHLRGEVHPHPIAGIHSRQKVSRTAPQFQNPRPARYEKGKIVLKQAMISSVSFPPAGQPGGSRVKIGFQRRFVHPEGLFSGC